MTSKLLTRICVAVAVLGGCQLAFSQQAQPNAEWRSLFDGQTLDGWKMVGSQQSKWEVVEGVIEGSGRASMLVSTTGPYRNFRYRVEMKINDGGNSGLYFRTKPEPGFLDGYEAQVDSTHSDPIRTGSIYGMCHVYERLVEPDTFFTYELQVRDDVWRGREMTRIKVTINGKELYEYLDFAKTFTEGHFAFQQHDPGSRVSIRKIEVMELPSGDAPVPAERPSRAAAAPVPPATPPTPTLVDDLTIGDEVTIHFDSTEVPALRDWVQSTLMPACQEWYPRIVEQLPSEGYEAPTEFQVVFREGMRGVAYTRGKDIFCAGSWYQSNLEGEATGSVIHELVHVVQQYRRSGGSRPPGWLVEGIADHIRWYQFEPLEKRRRINWDRANFDDSYFPSATFLDYIVNTIDADAITQINADCREGRFTDDYWQQHYGKTVAEIWADAKAAAKAGK